MVDLQVGPAVFAVEIAATEADRRVGLMNRDHLPDDQGMLFVFPADQQLSFWMKDTLIPLSIAFIASDGRIREIHDMQPQSLRPVVSAGSLRYALEVNQGAFTRRGVAVGDQVIIPESVRAAAR